MRGGGTRLPVDLLGAVGSGQTRKTMPLHHPRRAAPFADAGDINRRHILENIHQRENLADLEGHILSVSLVLFVSSFPRHTNAFHRDLRFGRPDLLQAGNESPCPIQAELANIPLRFAVRFGGQDHTSLQAGFLPLRLEVRRHMALFGAGRSLAGFVLVTQLNRGITVLDDLFPILSLGGGVLYLKHRAGTNLENRHRFHGSVRLEYLRHADLRAQESDRHGTPRPSGAIRCGSSGRPANGTAPRISRLPLLFGRAEWAANLSGKGIL